MSNEETITPYEPPPTPTLPSGCSNRYVPSTGFYPCPSNHQATCSILCPYNQQTYKLEYSPDSPGANTPVCMTEEELKSINKSFCESYAPPKMADQNSKCVGNNFIESETGYRQATQCVCAPYKSSDIYFVT